MKKLKKNVTVALLSVILASCGETCASELLATSLAPDGHAQATFSRANCGATTGYSYEVRVFSDGNASIAGETVLRFDDNHAVNWPNDDRDVLSMSWVAERQLVVTVNSPIRIFLEERSVDGISVSFKTPAGTARM